MELTVWLRPVAHRFLLIGQVHPLSPMLNPRSDVRLWMRWVESQEAGVERARIEFAESTRRDEENRTAWIVARAAIVQRGASCIYRLLEIQGLVDLWVSAPPAPDGSLRQVVPWLACADLSRRSARYGLATTPFPLYYV
ncbi:MAG: hypothetical protein OXU81_07275 [Gammaproteobacteria bacterium]|nr:hypothetical protein [Gammaproteobacteria bacterium]